MATVCGFSPVNRISAYATLSAPVETQLTNAGFVATGVILPPVATLSGRPIPINPATGNQPEIWVRNGPGDVNAPTGEITTDGHAVTIKEHLEGLVARVQVGVPWTKSSWGLPQIQAWYQTNPTSPAYVVFQS